MPLSWNEIKSRAVEFSKEWENETSEDAEAKTFWDGFFNVFGITRKRLASFEFEVKKHGGNSGFIDLFWPGVLIVEHKSRGKSLDKAYGQALDYFPGLSEDHLPKYVLVSDFARFRLYDLETGAHKEFLLKDLHKNVGLFGFIAGYQKQKAHEQDPANQKAAELMASLHDTLAEIGYTGHQLEVFLVRILFCLFADDTGIFDLKDQFYNYVEWRPKEDGSDLGMHLNGLFEVLNTPPEKRQKTLDEELAAFPYVNGGLFAETLPVAAFNSQMRKALLKCCDFDWSNISPAIFGSMFQGVMDKKERRALGAHYTSEANILKLIKPLFLDELWAEFEKIKHDRQKLYDFQNKLASLKFLDPACGCGNFLVIAYRELRRLELEVLKLIYKAGFIKFPNVASLIKVNPEQFYGIEIGEFAGRIAETAMWLVDHQMNMLVSEQLGTYWKRLPLDKAAHITIGNALMLDWESFVSKNELSYILGNPPFVGSKMMDPQQRREIEMVFDNAKGVGVLDYVTGWYAKAAKYIQGTQIKCAFVSTNSITQGEQVGILWSLLYKYGIKIHFAHRTFKWSNEARGKAAVYCVIIGFANFDTDKKVIYDYEDIKGEPHEVKAKNINPYLVDADDIIIEKRSIPFSNGTPSMSFGSMPNDDGHFLLTQTEKEELERKEQGVEKFIKPFLSAKGFLNNEKEWCLWFVDAESSDLKKYPEIYRRLELIKEYRLKSKRNRTRQLANFPAVFGENHQPNDNYILVPRVSSENRKYIPMGFFTKDYIVGDTCMSIPNATLYHFGVLESEMHMAWVRYVCGRLKSDFRYSKDIVYNNFPWPDIEIGSKWELDIFEAAQEVLNVRAKYPNSSLADLYDPLTMPADLVKAHQNLDRAVDAAYGKTSFKSSAERMEFLFGLYKTFVK